jgi:hypothetical protein
MSNYIVRVELHSAGSEDYEILYAQMEQRDYSRTTVGSDGFTYELPTGTYVVRDTNIVVGDSECDREEEFYDCR